MAGFKGDAGRCGCLRKTFIAAAKAAVIVAVIVAVAKPNCPSGIKREQNARENVAGTEKIFSIAGGTSRRGEHTPSRVVLGAFAEDGLKTGQTLFHPWCSFIRSDATC